MDVWRYVADMLEEDSPAWVWWMTWGQTVLDWAGSVAAWAVVGYLAWWIVTMMR